MNSDVDKFLIGKKTGLSWVGKEEAGGSGLINWENMCGKSNELAGSPGAVVLVRGVNLQLAMLNGSNWLWPRD